MYKTLQNSSSAQTRVQILQGLWSSSWKHKQEVILMDPSFKSKPTVLGASHSCSEGLFQLTLPLWQVVSLYL